MIRYALVCRAGHDFESWFSSAESYDSLEKAGHVTCPTCGAAEVSKSLMAPGIAAKKGDTQPETALSTPRTQQEAALAALRKKVEAESDYVGMNFAAEARAIHEGQQPARSIYGEACLADAKSLLEDGIPVAPLPFRPRSRAN